MENENNNYSFTPITEDNSVNEIKNDFFGGNSAEPNVTTNNEVPPILEVPKIENGVKEETITPPVEENKETTVAEPNVEETKVEEKTAEPIGESNNESMVSTPVQIETPTPEVPPLVETNIEENKVENTTTNEMPAIEETIQEVNASTENVASEPVEVKIPVGLDEESTEDTPAPVAEPVVLSAETVANNTESATMTSAQPIAEPVSNQEPVPIVEQPVQITEQANNPEPQPEAPKKGKSIFDFFKTKGNPDNSQNEPSPEKSANSDPFNNFVVDAPESVTSPEEPVIEPPVIENNEPIIEASLPIVEEKKTVVEESQETPKISDPQEEVSLPTVDEPIPDPVIESTPEYTPEPDFNNLEITKEEPVTPEEPPKEEEPIVKEVVVEKEKVVLGKKCPNCGEITAEAFCPNCGFLVE